MAHKELHSEKQLLALCKRGDNAGQRAVFEIHKKAVMVICRRYCKNAEDASDCFQESFVNIFQGLTKSKEVRSLDKWIRTVTINTNINFLKKEKIRDHELFIPETISDGQFLHIIENIAIEELNQVLNNMPDGYRLIFNLYVIDGYKHSEIASELGISVSTSRSQLAKAKRYLKIELQKIGIENYEKAI